MALVGILLWTTFSAACSVTCCRKSLFPAWWTCCGPQRRSLACWTWQTLSRTLHLETRVRPRSCCGCSSLLLILLVCIEAKIRPSFCVHLFAISVVLVADGTNAHSFRMLKLRQRDLSAVQDCSAAFSFITFRREWHEQLITHNAVCARAVPDALGWGRGLEWYFAVCALCSSLCIHGICGSLHSRPFFVVAWGCQVPTLLEMSKLDCPTVRSNVATALCNLSYSSSIVSHLVDLDVVSVLIQVRMHALLFLGRSCKIRFGLMPWLALAEASSDGPRCYPFPLSALRRL